MSADFEFLTRMWARDQARKLKHAAARARKAYTRPEIVEHMNRYAEVLERAAAELLAFTKPDKESP